MKKIIRICQVLTVSLLLISMLFACKSSNVISPVWQKFDVKSLPDGEYPVSFYVEDFEKEDGATYLKCKIYTVDEYNESDLKNAKVGDSISRGGQDVKIESILWYSDNTVCIINFPSYEEAAEEYRKDDATGYYKMYGPDDYHTYTERGTARLPISDSCTYIDDSDLVKGTQYIKVNDILTYLNENKDSVPNYCTNTNIIVEGGVITTINKAYTP